MKFNKWTLGLAAAGVVSLAAIAQAEEAQQHQVMTALASTTLSGYVDTSAIWKLGTGNAMLPGRSYDGAGKQDGFNLNVARLSLEKPLDEGQWSAGYKVDLLFGPDASTFATTSPGVATTDFAVQQAYVALRAPVGNGLDIKLGVWDQIIGYEVFAAGDNPNYSRSYGYFIEPTTYTGALASYKINDVVSLSAGIADVGAGTAATINSRSTVESRKTYMGMVTLTAPESLGWAKGASLSVGAINQAAFAAGFTSVQNFYAGVTIPTPLTGLSLGASYDYRGSGHFGSIASGFYTPGTYANAADVYVSFQASEKLKFNGRAEYASGSPGSFGAFTKAGSGSNDKYLGLTFTTDYSLWANVISRAELRWDHDLSGGPLAFGTAAQARRNAASVAMNVIYKF